jgi:hypothetical protein
MREAVIERFRQRQRGFCRLQEMRIAGTRIEPIAGIAAGLRPFGEHRACEICDIRRDGLRVGAPERTILRFLGRRIVERRFQRGEALNGHALLRERHWIERVGIAGPQRLRHLASAETAPVGPEENALETMVLRHRAKADVLDAPPCRDEAVERALGAAAALFGRARAMAVERLRQPLRRRGERRITRLDVLFERLPRKPGMIEWRWLLSTHDRDGDTREEHRRHYDEP